MFVSAAISASLDDLALKSAIEDISPSSTVAASMFLPTLKALDVFLNKGVNNLNALADSAAAASLPIAAPAVLIPALATLPLNIAPTAYPEFLINLSNKKFALSQLSEEYHLASFSTFV